MKSINKVKQVIAELNLTDLQAELDRYLMELYNSHPDGVALRELSSWNYYNALEMMHHTPDVFRTQIEIETKRAYIARRVPELKKRIWDDRTPAQREAWEAIKEATKQAEREHKKKVRSPEHRAKNLMREASAQITERAHFLDRAEDFGGAMSTLYEMLNQFGNDYAEIIEMEREDERRRQMTEQEQHERDTYRAHLSTLALQNIAYWAQMLEQMEHEIDLYLTGRSFADPVIKNIPAQLFNELENRFSARWHADDDPITALKNGLKTIEATLTDLTKRNKKQQKGDSGKKSQGEHPLDIQK